MANTIDIECLRIRLLNAFRDYIDDPNSFNLGYLLGVKHSVPLIDDDHLDSLCDGISGYIHV